VLPLRAVSNAGSDHSDGEAAAVPALSEDILGGAANDNL
jgi:hypothetical protein